MNAFGLGKNISSARSGFKETRKMVQKQEVPILTKFKNLTFKPQNISDISEKKKGGTLMQRLTLHLHRENVTDLNWAPLSVGSLYVLPVLEWVFSRCSGSPPHSPKTYREYISFYSIYYMFNNLQTKIPWDAPPSQAALT
ncbi:hypothetical protein AMECASPLE_029108 [Ameca splendens]|uniref:Uncharacterized protein n=1 Tax=Ameca splendens TaxID=208324 RepID=A0ABV0Y664_9TELE